MSAHGKRTAAGSTKPRTKYAVIQKFRSAILAPAPTLQVSRQSSTTAMDPRLKQTPKAPTAQKERVSPASVRESFAIFMVLSLGFLILALGFFGFLVGLQQSSVDGSGTSREP